MMRKPRHDTTRRRLLRRFGGLAAGAACSLGLPGRVSAAVAVRWLHIEQNPQVLGFYTDVAKRYQAANPGTQIEMQYLENDAYKKKLTTLLQSPAKPHLIYSWGGGVLREQVKAGVVQDLTPALTPEWRARFNPTALGLYTLNGQTWGLPMITTQVGFFTNKTLLAKAGVDAATIKTWDDFVAAVKKLQAAGITPLMLAGADKWPVHFYWSHLALRLGGKAAFDAAMAGQGGGFNAPTFVKAGEMLRDLAALKPFQNGYQAANYGQAAGQFGDGRGAMMLIMDGLRNTMQANAANKTGLPDEQLGWFPFPVVAGGAGSPDDTLGGMNGWLVTQGAPKETLDFLKFLTDVSNQRIAAERGFYIPVTQGAAAALQQPILRRIGDNVARSPYHQLFYDQMLGPAVGAVVNDVSVDITTGRITPADAAAKVQQAWQRAR